MKTDVAIIKKRIIIGIITVACFLGIGYLLVFAEDGFHIGPLPTGSKDRPEGVRLGAQGIADRNSSHDSDSIGDINKNIKNEFSVDKGAAIEDTLLARIYVNNDYSQIDLNDNTKIRLTGRLPKGAIAKAYKVPVNIKGFNVLLAYDIKIFDASGAEFQPSIHHPIKVAFESSKLKGNANTDIYHLKDKNSTPEKVANKVKVAYNKISFEADSFSIYVLGDETVKRYKHRYEFYDRDGNELTSLAEELYEGEILKEPVEPQIDNHIFEGWFKSNDPSDKENYETQFELWNKEPPWTNEELNKGDRETTKLYARYRGEYYVYYMSEARDSTDQDPVMVRFTQQYPIKEEHPINFDDVPIETKEGFALIGWSLRPDGSRPVDNNVTKVNRDMTVYPIIKEAYWITYDAKGGTFVDPTYVLKGDISVAPDEPTRAGYSFGGWYTDKDFNNRYTFNQTVSNNIKLYAKWVPAQTTYTVNFWEQNPTDSKNASNQDKTYSFSSSIVRNGTTGDMATIEYNDKRKDLKDPLYHFHYNPVNSSTATKIKADGSTILNVYYDRDLFTIQYYRYYNDPYYNQKLNAQTGLFESSLAANNYEWDETYTWREPDSGVGYTFLTNFIFPEDSYDLVDTKDPDNPYREKTTTLKLNRETKKYGNSTLSHFVQQLDGTYSNVPANRTESTANTFTLTNKYRGFTVKKYRKKYHNSGNWSGDIYISNEEDKHIRLGPFGYYRNYLDLNIYYERNKYDLKYAYGANGKEIDRARLLFEEPISSKYERGEPQARPTDANGNSLAPYYYEFAGWFKDPKGYTPFKFDGSQKMDATNTVAYAVWKPKTVKLKFNLTGGVPADGVTMDEYADQIFDAGTMAYKPADPVKEKYEFAGWLDEKTNTPVNFEKVLTRDASVKAAWISKEGYRTKYYANNGSAENDGKGKAHLGPKIYAPGSRIKVVGIGDDWDFTVPHGYAGFLHWNTKPDDTGEIYYPGSYHNHDGLELYAIWGKSLDTSLIYDKNISETGSPRTVVELENHSKVPIGNYRDKDAGGGTVWKPININRTDGRYNFLGWTRDRIWDGDKKKLIHNGTMVEVDSKNDDSENILYAQWQKVITVSINKNVVGGLANEYQKFKFRWKIEYNGNSDSGEIQLANSDGDETIVFDKSKLMPDEFSETFLSKEIPEGAKVTVEEIGLEPTSHKFESIEAEEIKHTENLYKGTIEGMKWSFDVTHESNDMKVIYTNRRDAPKTPITGIISTNKPYIILTIPALLMMGIFALRRRRCRFEE